MREHAVVRMPSVQNKSLMPSGSPSSGPPSPRARRSSDARAMARARSGVSSTKALSARALATASRCASVSSIAENSFWRSASRACASVSKVRSVIRPSGRRRKMGFGRPASARSWPALRAWDYPTRPAPAAAARENPKTAPRPLPDRRVSTNPGFRDSSAKWRLVRRRGTLFHHLRNEEKVMLVRRGIGDDGVGNAAIGYLVVAHLHRHRRDRGHRLDAFDIGFGQLLDKGKDGVEFALKARHFVF